VSFRSKDDKKPKEYPDALPVFTVDTEKEANMLITFFCKLAYDGRMLLTSFKGEYEELEGVTKKFAEWYDRRKKKA